MRSSVAALQLIEETAERPAPDLFVSLRRRPERSAGEVDAAWDRLGALAVRHGARFYPGGRHYAAIRFKNLIAREAFLADPSWEEVDAGSLVECEEWPDART